jgi:hypothetical protein
MGDRRARITIVSEDLQHEVFVRNFLVELKFERRKIVVVTCPPGSRSGEQYVREQYPRQLRAHRGAVKYRQVALIIITDADNLTVEGRRQQLEGAVASAGSAPRADDEGVAIAIPRRNIETWIHYLMGQAVDETTAYRKLDRESKCRPAVDRLVELYRSNWQLPDDCPDSLRQGVEELNRIL